MTIQDLQKERHELEKQLDQIVATMHAMKGAIEMVDILIEKETQNGDSTDRN